MMLKHAALPVPDLGCTGATGTIEGVLRRIPGVTRVYVNPITEMAYVEYDQERCNERELAGVLTHAGYGDMDTRPASQRPAPASPAPAPWTAALWSGVGFALSFLLGILSSGPGERPTLLLRAWDAVIIGFDPTAGLAVWLGLGAAFVYGGLAGWLVTAVYRALRTRGALT